jgi:DNA-binding IclR family transcriptional regulator
MSNAVDGAGAPSAPAALVQSVDRALNILEILAARGEAGVTEIAGELGVHKSTAFRLIAVLEARDLVEQNVERGKYRLGFGIVRLAGATTAQLDLSQESRRACERLAAALGETVNVAVLDENRAINITQVRGTSAIAAHNWVGQRTPLHATSSGKVLLAFASQAVQESVLEAELRRYTSATITDPERLRAELAEVSERGWSATAQEFEMGLNGVAAPVYGNDGRIVAALSVSGPSYRLPEEAFPRVAEEVRAAAAEMSRRIGCYVHTAV